MRPQDRLLKQREAGLCSIGSCRNTPEPGRSMCGDHAAYYRNQNIVQRNSARAKVIEGYGGACVRCGIDDPDVLEFHHPNGDSKERGDRKSSGMLLYRLIREGFPDYIELLCANCHVKHHRNTPSHR